MELEDMKQLWQKMDDVLSQQKVINDKMINYLLKDKSAKPINTISIAEYSNYYSSIAIFIAMLFVIPYLGTSIGIIACYLFLMVALAATVYFAKRNINAIKSIDLGNTPVSDLMVKTEKLKLEIKRFQIVFILLGPLLIGSACVVMFKVVHNINALEDISRLLPSVGIATVAYVFILVAVYQTYYFKNIKTIQSNLAEAENYKL